MTSVTQKSLPTAAGFTAPARQRLTFAYDYRHRRIAKKVEVADSNEATGWRLTKDLRFVYDGIHMIAELDHTFATGTGLTGSRVLRTYLWGPDLSGTMTGAGGVGGLLSFTNHLDNTTYHVCSDANGNVTGLVPANGPDAGKLIARFDYDPFGNRITNTGPDVELCPFGFSTQYTDSETGLVAYLYRYYSPEMGRFASTDPIEESGGVNLYGFVGNDPVNTIDVLGRNPMESVDPHFGTGLPRTDDANRGGADFLEAHVFTTPISGTLYRNYRGRPTATINPFPLSEDQMAQVTDTIHLYDLRFGPNGVNELVPLVQKWLNQPSWTSQPLDVKNVKVSQMATDQVSLGQFRIILNGSVRCEGGEPMFEGTMTFEDNWDLLRHNSGSSTRSGFVNNAVDFAGQQFPGTAFRVSSASVSVKQKYNSDPHAHWSGAKAGKSIHTSGTYYIY